MMIILHQERTYDAGEGNIIAGQQSVKKLRDHDLWGRPWVKAMVFPVIYGCESWTIKKAECRIIDAFELSWWRILLRVPWTARRSNQSILREIIPEYSLEGLMQKLKLQYFGHLMGRTDSLEKTRMHLWILCQLPPRTDRAWIVQSAGFVWTLLRSGIAKLLDGRRMR